MKYNRVAMAVLLSGMLAGCALTNIKAVEQNASDRYDENASLLKDVRGAEPQAIQRSTRPWVDTTPIVTSEPSHHELNCVVTYATSAAVLLSDVGQAITAMCGVPVRITPDVYASSQSGSADLRSPGGGPLPTAAPTSADAAGADLRVVGLQWEGRPLRELLDVVTARLGLGWEFNNGAVEIFRTQTKVYRLHAFSNKVDVKSMVQGGGSSNGSSSMLGVSSGAGGQGSSSGGSTGGTQQSASVSIQSSIAADVFKMVEGMVTPLGRVTASPSTGTVTVTDVPSAQARIRKYLSAENRNLTRQALFNITVAVVELTDTNDLGLDLAAVYKSLNGNYGISLDNGFTTSAATGNAKIGILDTATGRAAQFAGSEAILRALSSQGKVSIVTQPSVTTLNLQPVPVLVAKETSYLAAVTGNTVSQVGVQTQLTPGLVTSGFAMNLMPYMLNAEQMLLQFTMNMSSDPRIRKAESGDNSIETPEQDRRTFSQAIRIRSGQTLLLTGFEQNTDRGNRAGMGDASNWILGGGGSSVKKRDVVVILISPVVSEDTGPEEIEVATSPFSEARA